MLTIPENKTANIKAWDEIGNGVGFASAKYALKSLSNEGLWTARATGWTFSQYCSISISARNLVGQKSFNGWSTDPEKKKGLAGAM